MVIQIERDVPMPEEREVRPRQSLAVDVKAAVKGMEVGDSFVVPGPADWRWLRMLASYFMSRGMRMRRQRQADGSTRVWRVA